MLGGCPRTHYSTDLYQFLQRYCVSFQYLLSNSCLYLQLYVTRLKG